MRAITDKIHKEKGRKLLSKTSRQIDISESMSQAEDWIEVAHDKNIITDGRYAMYTRLHTKLKNILTDYDVALNIIKDEIK